MAYIRPYRVAETSTTTGTGAITLAGAVTGYLAFTAELANADTATIVIEAIDSAGRPTGQWEICDTAFTSPDTLSRGTFKDSSTGSRIDFAAGAKRVFAINPRDVVDLGSADLIGTLGVADGGTGATDATGARANLSAAASGANADITSMTGLTGGIATTDFVTFDTAAAATVATGRIAWDADMETFHAGLTGAFPLHIGQDVIFLAKNDSGGSVAKGRGVMFAGVVGGSSKLEYTNAVSNGTISHEYIMGIAAQTVANGDFGYIVEFGTVRGFNTTGANKTVPETWVIGDFLYFDPAYPGELTKVEPQAPAWHSPVAVVTNVNASSGSVFVRAKTGEKLSELHDVRINGLASGQVLIYDAAQSRWENNTLTAGTSISVTNAAGAITIANTAPDQTVSLTGAGTTSITGTYPNFTITSNDAFTGTVTSVGGTGTVNGLTLTGTVTGSGNLTLGGALSGVNLTTQVTGTLPVANGGTGATTLTGVIKGTGTSALTAGTVSLTTEVSGTLPVANGGTGATTLAANNVLLGNGTSALQAVAPGANGNILTSNGTTWVSSAAAGGAVSYPQNIQSADYTLVLGDAGKQIFHPASDTNRRTYTIPSNASVAFPIGTVVLFAVENNGQAVTVKITSDILVFGNGTTGNVVVPANQTLMAIKITSTKWMANYLYQTGEKYQLPQSIAVAHNFTPFITAYPWGVSGFGAKYSNPVTLPTGFGLGVAFSPAGDAIAVAHSVSPRITAYPWSGSGFGTKFANPATLPPDGINVAFNPLGNAIAVTSGSTPFITAYPWSSSGFGTKFANPATLPVDSCNGVAFSPAGDAIAVVHPTSPRITAYPWSGSGFGTKFANPATALPWTAYGVAFNPTGDAIAVAHGDSPAVTVYSWSGSGFGTKYTNPSTVPSNEAYGVTFNPVGDTIAVSGFSPYITAYPWSGSGFGTKFANPVTLPAGNGRGVAFSPAGDAIAVAHINTPFVTAYPWNSSGFGTKFANPATLPTGDAYGVAFTINP